MPVLKAYINGEWVRVGGGSGGGTDEVWIGNDEPVDPAIELWYDPDAVNTNDPDTARWNSAWGRVASVVVTSSQSVPAGGWTEISGSRATFTAVAGRRYLVSMQVSASQTGAASGVWGQIQDADSGLEVAVTKINVISGDFLEIVLSCESTPAAGTKTYCIRLYTEAGAVATQAFGPGGSAGPSLRVEDVGPVSPSTAPPASPPSVWTPLPFAGTWANYDAAGSYELCTYRMVGDITQLRGLAKSTGTDYTICTLPVGFRPPRALLFPTYQAVGAVNSVGRVDVFPDGRVQAQTHQGAGPFPYFSLNIAYSVTP
jgi:hypothetical protein